MTSGQKSIISITNKIPKVYGGIVENRMSLSLILLKILKKEMRQISKNHPVES